MSEIEDIQRILGLWEAGLLPEAEVVAWADRKLLNSASPSGPLMDLSLHGPKKCLLLRPSLGFPHPYSLSFREELSLRASTLALESDAAAEDFVRWLSWSCIGEDLALPEVELGYQVDHLWNDCGSMSLAVQCVRRELPSLLPACKELAAAFRAALDEPVEEAPT